MSSTPWESGIQPHRLEFVRETTEGEAPTDPDFLLYSDNVSNFDPTIDPQAEGKEGLGDPNYQEHFTGTRADSLTVEYHLQQWFVDGSDNPQDAAYDALVRDANNRIPNTHTVVRRMEQTGIAEANTVDGGSGSKDTRQYWVGLGGSPNVTITGDPTDAQPIPVSLEYTFERADAYQIDQPDSSTTLDVVSSSDDDTTITVTIEDEGATTSEDVLLGGTTTQTTTETFADIDAIYLDGQTTGDVTVSVNGGEDLAVIQGSESMDVDGGQIGVPALGAGSRASAIGTEYELFHDDTVTFGSGSLAEEVNTTELSVENNFENLERGGSVRPANASGLQEPEVSGTVFGETEYFDQVVDMITTTEGDIDWTFSGGTLRVEDAVVMETSGSEEASQAIKEIDVTWSGKGITIDPV